MPEETPITTIRYRFGMAPDRQLTSEPSLREVISELNLIDGAVLAVSVLLPSYYGYRLRRK